MSSELSFDFKHYLDSSVNKAFCLSETPQSILAYIPKLMPYIQTNSITQWTENFNLGFILNEKGFDESTSIEFKNFIEIHEEPNVVRYMLDNHRKAEILNIFYKDSDIKEILYKEQKEDCFESGRYSVIVEDYRHIDEHAKHAYIKHPPCYSFDIDTKKGHIKFKTNKINFNKSIQDLEINHKDNFINIQSNDEEKKTFEQIQLDGKNKNIKIKTNDEKTKQEIFLDTKNKQIEITNEDESKQSVIMNNNSKTINIKNDNLEVIMDKKNNIIEFKNGKSNFKITSNGIFSTADIYVNGCRLLQSNEVCAGGH